MTHVYFVRHALPEHNWTEDRTRPLTAEGTNDIHKVTEALKDIHFDYAISSPYIRSMGTISECVNQNGLELVTDERFRERQRGSGNSIEMLHKRWEDFNFHEEGGESLGMVRQRNLEALEKVLKEHKDETIIIGTHGTALSSMLSFYDASFTRENFLRIVNYMPYIIRLDFDGLDYVGKEEILVVDKNFTEYNKAYKTKTLENGLEKCSCVRKKCERFGNCEACIEHHKTHKHYKLPYCTRKAEKASR